MDGLNLIRLCADASMMVLIWIVQLIIYPGFRYYSSNDLLLWHRTYTPRISVIVAPLMILQLFLTIVAVWQNPGTYQLGTLIIILILWIYTFVKFLPLHRSIEHDKIKTDTLKILISANWLRTLLWTLVFIWSLFQYFWNM